MRFEDVVAEWLRSRGTPADQVVKVEAYGTDWAGDTYSGFHSRTDVTIHYLVSGESRRTELEGEDEAALWRHVMGAWPDA